MTFELEEQQKEEALRQSKKYIKEIIGEERANVETEETNT